MRINTNINSMRTQEYMRQNQAKMSNAMDRLSSGKRINNASDDAAGLAIATRMRARESGLGVAADNTQNGMSLIRTADSAMNSVSNILLRMRDIANQSANGTNTNDNKSALQKEFAELQKQITYIADNTQFNDKNLLKEDSTVSIQTLDSSTTGQQIGIDLKAVTLEKLGINNISIGEANATTGTTTDATILQKDIDAVKAINTLTKDSSVDTDIKAIKEGLDNIKDAMDPKDVQKLTEALNGFQEGKSDADESGVTAIKNALKDITLPTANSIEITQKNIDAVKAINTLTKDSSVDTDIKAIKEGLDNIKGAMDPKDVQKLTEALNGFQEGKSDADESGVTAIKNALKDITLPTVGTAKLTTTSEASKADTSKADALAAIDAIDKALTKVADNRATLGATLNRLDFNVNNLKSQQSSMSAAASQVEDADMAKEMSEMTKFKILNEAGISMLSQANQTPQMVSKLLQ
ncbi:flagellin [Bacillus paranthracis]|uniref:flagellin N-terminal helical domain-containing protein n=1 Tax=Bacillus paranthracis TaxID=2026186 RepID=UPI000D6A9B3C|nr:flagellin [Bacillus paranthracis]PWN73987.1 flagellin [Bacillus cereus]PWN79760.1 flagellin [Bacillus cereus]UHJ48995.1 flagellin [Bacillus paranthracis]